MKNVGNKTFLAYVNIQSDGYSRSAEVKVETVGHGSCTRWFKYDRD